jgi:hypothetical protein
VRMEKKNNIEYWSMYNMLSDKKHRVHQTTKTNAPYQSQSFKHIDSILSETPP